MIAYFGGINHMFYVKSIFSTIQLAACTWQNFFGGFLDFLEAGNYLAGIVATIIGGYCALKGIGYLESLREKKAGATFSFEIQLYAHLYELKTILGHDERLLTGLYSESARKEWKDRSAASVDNLAQFYTCTKSTFDFIKAASDQMPVYKNWVIDYTMLIQFLVDILHYDIRDTKNNFKYHEMCNMEERTRYWESVCNLLNTLLTEIKRDQMEIAEELFLDESHRRITTNQEAISEQHLGQTGT